MPRLAASWIRASSRPWVTQTSGAATSSRVAFSSSQSLWSLMTSGSSTPLLRARWRTCIQPEALQTTGSAMRRAQGPVMAPGGAITMAPRSRSLSALDLAVAGRRSPSLMPMRS